MRIQHHRKIAIATGLTVALLGAADAARALSFPLSNTLPPSTTQPSSGLQYNKIGDPVKLLLDFEYFGGVAVTVLTGSPGSYTEASTADDLINASALMISGRVAGFFSDVLGNFANADGTLCGGSVTTNCFDFSNSGAFDLDFLYEGGISFDPKASPISYDPGIVFDFDNGAIGDILALDEGANTNNPLYTVNSPAPLEETDPGVGAGALVYLGKLDPSATDGFSTPAPPDGQFPGENLTNFLPFLSSECFVSTGEGGFPDCSLDMAISPLAGDQFSIGGEFDPVSFALYPVITAALKADIASLGFSGDFNPEPDPVTQGVFCTSPDFNAQGGGLPTDPAGLADFCSTPIADSNGVLSLPNAGLGPVTLSQVVPEPATVALTGLALAGMLGFARRRV